MSLFAKICSSQKLNNVLKLTMKCAVVVWWSESDELCKQHQYWSNRKGRSDAHLYWDPWKSRGRNATEESSLRLAPSAQTMGVEKLLSRWIQEGKPQILRRPRQLLQQTQTVYTQSWKVFSRKYYYPCRLGHSQIPRSFCGAHYLCHMQLGRKCRTYSCAKKQVARTRCDVRIDLKVFFAWDSSAHYPAAVYCVPGAIFQRAGKSLRLRLR